MYEHMWNPLSNLILLKLLFKGHFPLYENSSLNPAYSKNFAQSQLIRVKTHRMKLIFLNISDFTGFLFRTSHINSST